MQLNMIYMKMRIPYNDKLRRKHDSFNIFLKKILYLAKINNFELFNYSPYKTFKLHLNIF